MKQILLLVLAVSIMIFLYGTINYTSDQYAGADLHMYRAMAEASPNIAHDVRQPFAYRLLGPYLVGLFPVRDDVGFYMFSAAAALSLAIIFYSFLRYSGIGQTTASLTTFLFMCNRYFFGFPVWNYFQLNDILSSILLIILVWSMLGRKWKLFGAGLLIGTLIRETPLVMIPVAAVYLTERKESISEWKKLALASAPAIASFFLLRQFIPVSGGYSLPEAFLLYIRKYSAIETWFSVLIVSFVPLSFLPVIFFRRTEAFFSDKKYLLVYLALVFISTSLGHDNQRLMSPSFLVFYPLIAVIIEHELHAGKWLITLLALGSFAASLHHQSSRFPLPDRNVTIVLSMGSLLVVTATMAAVKYRKKTSRKQVLLRKSL